MKRFILTLLAAASLLSLAACGSQEKPAAEFDADALEADAGALADELLAGDFESVTASFDAKMAKALNSEKLQTAWESTVAGLGAYAGRVSSVGEEQDGYYVVSVVERFESGGLQIRIVYSADAKVAGLFFTYADVSEPEEVSGEYEEHDLTVAGDPALPLGATLTLPTDAEKPPVVILVQGSGQSDRDESVFGNRPFSDIAGGLAELGVATLRYDKRYFTYPESAPDSVTLRDEILDDVGAAIALMLSDDRVDGERVYVLGHSLGGMLVPAIAAEHPELAGVISMAGSLRPLWEISYDQNMEAVAAIDMTQLSDADRAVLEQQLTQLETDMSVLRGDLSATADDALLLGLPAAYWKSLDEYGGMNFIESIDLPMLILQGDADFQVYPDKDYALWQEELAGRDNVSFRLYEGLNHIFMPTQGKRDISEYQTAGHVDEAVIADIAAFVS